MWICRCQLRENILDKYISLLFAIVIYQSAFPNNKPAKASSILHFYMEIG